MSDNFVDSAKKVLEKHEKTFLRLRISELEEELKNSDNLAAKWQEEYSKAIEAAEKLAEALEFYADKTNYNLCDEGRNYMSHYVCYEMNKESYADDELGTMARKTLAEYRKSKGE